MFLDFVSEIIYYLHYRKEEELIKPRGQLVVLIVRDEDATKALLKKLFLTKADDGPT